MNTDYTVARAGSTVNALTGSIVIARYGSDVTSYTGSTVHAYYVSEVTAYYGSIFTGAQLLPTTAAQLPRGTVAPSTHTTGAK